jgi:hypothetical protein
MDRESLAMIKTNAIQRLVEKVILKVEYEIDCSTYGLACTVLGDLSS